MNSSHVDLILHEGDHMTISTVSISFKDPMKLLFPEGLITLFIVNIQ